MSSERNEAGYLRPRGYRPRLVDSHLKRLLKTNTIVRLVGPHGSGKSWCALSHGKSVVSASDESIRPILESAPEHALAGGQSPHVVDEWQIIPTLAKTASQAPYGSYLLVSSTDNHPKDERYVARTPLVRLWPFTLVESGVSNMSVSLMGLFSHGFYPMSCSLGLPELAEVICVGGWPRMQGIGAENAARLLRVQLQTVLENELPARSKRVPMAVRVVCAQAARGWKSTYEDRAHYVEGHGEKPFSRKTERDYAKIFRETYLTYQVDGWKAPIRSVSRVRFKPRTQFVDPSLPAMLLAHTPETLLDDAPALLELMRCLVLRDLNVYMSVLNPEEPTVHYYADSDGACADAVVALPDGRWGAINVAIGDAQFEQAARGLTRLRSKLGKNPDNPYPEPSFLAVAMGSCHRPRLDKRTGVYAFPIGCLTV